MTTNRTEWFPYLWSKHGIMERKTPPHANSNISEQETGRRSRTDHLAKSEFLLLVLYQLLKYYTVAMQSSNTSFNQGQSGLAKGSREVWSELFVQNISFSLETQFKLWKNRKVMSFPFHPCSQPAARPWTHSGSTSPTSPAPGVCTGDTER